MINKANLTICIMYGLISTCQTLNSRYLFRTIGFNFYAFAFLMQRIVNMIISKLVWGTKFHKQDILTVIPYTILMCTTNILSSYCVTVMPLAAFMAFKKFIVFFVLIIACLMKFPHNFNKIQYFCIFMIVAGGALVGERDILNGQFIGYLVALLYNICQASTLQYQSYMRRQKDFEPSGTFQYVFYMNSILSLPYYLVIMTAESQFDEIFDYFLTKSTPEFAFSFTCLLILACLSEFTASYIAMKISPFQKATVSNIKDIFLTFISVYYFKDFILGIVSQIGIVLCLGASIFFSYSLLQKQSDKQGKISIQPYDQVELNIEQRIEMELREAEMEDRALKKG